MHGVSGAIEREGGQLIRVAQRQRSEWDQRLRLGPIAEALRGECHAQLGEETGGVDARTAFQERATPRQPRATGPCDAPPMRGEPRVDPVTGHRSRCDESRDLRQPYEQDVSG